MLTHQITKIRVKTTTKNNQIRVEAHIQTSDPLTTRYYQIGQYETELTPGVKKVLREMVGTWVNSGSYLKAVTEPSSTIWQTE